MPAYDPSLDTAEDPYFNAPDGEGLSAYERGVQEDRARQAREATVDRLVDQHRSEVEEACQVRTERLRIEAQRERFENDPAFRIRVAAARKARGILVFTMGIIALIFAADLFLGTPDLAEDLAHPVMSLMPESWLPAPAGDGTTSTETPNWLRLTIGVVLCTVVLALTIAVKLIGDETSVHRARRRLAAGDTQGWWSITRQLWAKRLVKGIYLVIMLGAFSWLHTYAEKRAEVMAKLASEPAGEMNWENLGLSILSTGEVKTDEAIPEPSEEENAESEDGGSLAKGAAATYAMLFILHALLLMLPMPSSTMDLPLAGFNPHRAETKAATMRAREELLLRGIVARIQRVIQDDRIRETLIILSEPVARAINELYQRNLMPLTGADEDPNTPPTFDTTAEVIPDLPRETGPLRFDEDDEDDGDPAQAIFGRSA
jgi:hypothetical protein